MISVEEREEARITRMVLSFQQGLQLSPGKCRFFPVGRLWILHSSPQAGAAPQQFLEAFGAQASAYCASFWVLIGAFKGFLCILYLGKANLKEPPQKPRSGCEYKMVSGNLPSIKNYPIPYQ